VGALAGVVVIVASLMVAAPSASAAVTLAVTPSTGLEGGDLIQIALSGATPGDPVAWCEGVVTASPSVSNCDTLTETFGTADASGSYMTTTRVQRYLFTDQGWIDCASPTGPRCGIGAEDVDQPSSMTVLPLQFATPPPPPATRGTITVTPTNGLASGGQISIVGQGFRSDATLGFALCAPGLMPPVDPSSCDGQVGEVVADSTGAFTASMDLPDPLVNRQENITECATTWNGLCQIVVWDEADMAGTAVGVPIAFTAAQPTVLPQVGSVLEGNSGTTDLAVPVTLSQPATQTVTVQWSTLFVAGLSQPQADPGTDYVPASGTLTFSPGATIAYAHITVNGDTVVEPDELIVVAFHDATNAVLGGFYGLGIGIIVNDD
jgi:hypothetical protein